MPHLVVFTNKTFLKLQHFGLKVLIFHVGEEKIIELNFPESNFLRALIFAVNRFAVFLKHLI